jgi:hypothetical protein
MMGMRIKNENKDPKDGSKDERKRIGIRINNGDEDKDDKYGDKDVMNEERDDKDWTSMKELSKG